MTSRTSYKPEGWPTAEDLALMSSQDVRDHEREIRTARSEFEALIKASLARAFHSWPRDERGGDSANARLVVAYRALKAWEAERK